MRRAHAASAALAWVLAMALALPAAAFADGEAPAAAQGQDEAAAAVLDEGPTDGEDREGFTRPGDEVTDEERAAALAEALAVEPPASDADAQAAGTPLSTLAGTVSYFTMPIGIERMASLQDFDFHSYAEYLSALSNSDVQNLQFADLRGYSGLTAAQLNAFINSTANGRAGALAGQGAAFVEAAKTYKINEAYLLAHAILETGWGTSKLAQGFTDGGKTYRNFFGIGAVDSNALSAGQATAKAYNWDSQRAAVLGGAEWITRNYTYRSSYAQPTLYAMRWDYARTAGTLDVGWHQYATSLTWTSNNAKLMQQIYDYARVSETLPRIVPLYVGQKATEKTSKYFTDVLASSWACDPIEFCYQYGIMSGYDDGTFHPAAKLTRAQAAVAIYRLFTSDKGSLVTADTTGFADVGSNMWYSKALNWVKSAGFMSGSTGADGRVYFRPGATLTREQMCTILANIGRMTGMMGSTGVQLSALEKMPDADQVQPYARESVAWCLQVGLVTGSNKNGKSYIAPRDAITRQQMSMLFKRICTEGYFI